MCGSLLRVIVDMCGSLLRVIVDMCGSLLRVIVDMCGWKDESNSRFLWHRRQGSSPSLASGPAVDHTQNTATGWYMFVDSGQGTGEKLFLSRHDSFTVI